MGPGCTFHSWVALVHKHAVVGEEAVGPVNGIDGKVVRAVYLKSVLSPPSVLMFPTLS